MILHTFTEMIDHIESGGVANRYGSRYPTYYKELSDGSGLLLRRMASSWSELIEGGHGHMPIHFSVDEQKCTDWILTEREKFDAADKAFIEAYQKNLQAHQAYMREKQVTVGGRRQVGRSFWLSNLSRKSFVR